MAAVKDFIHTGQLSDSSGALIGDLDFSSGDIKVNWSDNMHIEHIFKAVPGNFYQHPDIGIGIYQDINSNISSLKITKKIRQNMKSDNYREISLSISGTGDERIIDSDHERIQ